jgi:hypothetical protein
MFPGAIVGTNGSTVGTAVLPKKGPDDGISNVGNERLVGKALGWPERALRVWNGAAIGKTIEGSALGAVDGIFNVAEGIPDRTALGWVDGDLLIWNGTVVGKTMKGSVLGAVIGITLEARAGT